MVNIYQDWSRTKDKRNKIPGMREMILESTDIKRIRRDYYVQLCQ